MAKKKTRRTIHPDPILDALAKRKPTDVRLSKLCPRENDHILVSNLRIDFQIQRLTGELLAFDRIKLTHRGGFYRSELKNSRFVNSDFGDLGGNFTNCEIRNSRFQGGSLVVTSTFTDCVFDSCAFRRSRADYVTFRNCSFENCEFRGSTFSHCQFNKCRFPNSRFLDFSFGNCKFSQLGTHFKWTEFPSEEVHTYRSRSADATEVELVDTLMGGVEFR